MVSSSSFSSRFNVKRYLRWKGSSQSGYGSEPGSYGLNAPAAWGIHYYFFHLRVLIRLMCSLWINSMVCLSFAYLWGFHPVRLELERVDYQRTLFAIITLHVR